jgi:hypothetical protein
MTVSMNLSLAGNEHNYEKAVIIRNSYEAAAPSPYASPNELASGEAARDRA